MNPTVFGESAIALLQDDVVDHLQCLCGHAVSVRLADFDASVYCPSCGSELPVAKELTQFRQVDTADAPTSVESPSNAENIPAVARPLSWRPVSVVAITLIAFAVGVGLNWGDRQEIAGTIRRTFAAGDLGTPLPTDIAFDPAAVTQELIDQLRDYADPFAALTMAINWKQGISADPLHETDSRLIQIDQIIGDIMSDRADQMQQRINALQSLPDPDAAMRKGANWVEILQSVGVTDADSLMQELQQVLRLLDEQKNPITLAAIEELLHVEDLEQSLVQARLWESTLAARETPPEDVRSVRLDEVIAVLADRLSPITNRESASVAKCRSLLQQLSDDLKESRLDRAGQTAQTIRHQIAAAPGELSQFEPRLTLLEAQMRRLQNVAVTVDQLHKRLQHAAELADSGRITEAISTDAHVRFDALTTPMTSSAAQQLRTASQQVARQLRRAIGLRAVEDAIQLDQAGDLHSRNEEVRRAVERLSEFPAAEVGTALGRVEAWKDEALQQSDESHVRQASSLQHTIDHRHQVESLFLLYARGRLDEIYLQGMRILESPASTGDNAEVDELLVKCLLAAIRQQISSEFFDTSHGKSSDELLVGLDATEAKLKSLNKWDHLPQWRDVQSRVESLREELE